MQLMLDFMQKTLKLLGLLGQRTLLSHQCHQFDLQLRVKTTDHELHSIANLTYFLILGIAHCLHILFDIFNQAN